MSTLAVSATLFLSLMLAQKPEAALSDATLGAAPPEGAIVLFDGTNLDGWVGRDGKPAAWTVEDGAFVVAPGKGDILTAKSFEGDFHLHLEFNVPLMPDARGQGRGNSGVYLQGRHELQVLDSYGLDSKDNDCGGIYQQHAPAVNACKPPLEWQTYDVDFKAPVLDESGKVIEPAQVTIRHNGALIHENAQIRPTPGGVSMTPATAGPLLLQDHGNLVKFRNIWLVPKK